MKKKKRKRIVILLVLLVVAIISFNLGLLIGKKNFTGIAVKKIPSGTFVKAYSIREAFDRETGEPVYWIIGLRMVFEEIGGVKVPIHIGKILFMQVSRDQIVNPPTNPQQFDLILEIR